MFDIGDLVSVVDTWCYGVAIVAGKTTNFWQVKMFTGELAGVEVLVSDSKLSIMIKRFDMFKDDIPHR